MSESTIPVVDLREFLEGSTAEKQSFVNKLGDALRDVGFFSLANHNVQTAVVDNAYAVLEDFFKLPTEIKVKYENKALLGQRGYISYGREHAKDKKAPDLKEFFHVGREGMPDLYLGERFLQNIWPEERETETFKAALLELYRQMDETSMTLLRAVSLYIGRPENFLPECVEKGNTVLRLIHYPPVPDDADPESIRAAEHEDINLITLLCNATAAGLELKERDGSWRPVNVGKGEIIVDAGDMLQNLTNGFLKSTTHRVVNPDNTRERRFSMPFFVHPRSEISLSPLSECIEKTGGKRTYQEILAGDYLEKRLRDIGL